MSLLNKTTSKSVVKRKALYRELNFRKLQKDLKNIFYDQPKDCSYQELYMIVENICTLKKDEIMLESLADIIKDYLKLNLIKISMDENEDFLKSLRDFWLCYCEKSRLMENIFLYLKSFVSRKKSYNVSVWRLCLNVFKENIIDDEVIQQKLQFIYQLINDHRDNKTVDEVLLKQIIDMFNMLNLYPMSFENTFLTTSEEYFTNRRNILIKGNIMNYIYFVENSLRFETSRNYIQFKTFELIDDLLKKVLIENVLNTIMTKLVEVNFLATRNLNNIITIYKTVSLVQGGSESIFKAFNEFLLETGYSIFNGADAEVIKNLLDFKIYIDEMVRVCFENNYLFLNAVRSSFITIINQHKNKPAQLLAKFIDHKMRNRCIRENVLDHILLIFRYIEGKDVFEAYYKRYLAKRLLLGKSSSQDAERYMISKLKMECGDGFTAKLEGMLRDIDTSISLNFSLKQKFASENVNLDFTAYIITSTYWPTFFKHTANFPENLSYYQNFYQEFYKVKYSGRTLQWLPVLGSCLIKYTLFDSSIKELQTSLFQTLVLLFFNDTDKITYEEIKEQLSLDKVELDRTLWSLVSDRNKVLTKTPSDESFNPNDAFMINQDFRSKVYRVKMNEIQYRDTEQECKIIKEEVLLDRNHHLDAALVRIMKQHRNLTHSDLISEILKEIKFPVRSVDIKNRIEILIERDFIGRSLEKPDDYIYIA